MHGALRIGQPLTIFSHLQAIIKREVDQWELLSELGTCCYTT